jgi:hypothetical protein
MCINIKNNIGGASHRAMPMMVLPVLAVCFFKFDFRKGSNSIEIGRKAQIKYEKNSTKFFPVENLGN